MIVGTWHVGLHVSDIERSIAFYRDCVGLELVHRQEQRNSYTSRLVGYQEAHLRVAQLRIPYIATGTVSSHLLELVEYVSPRGPRPSPERNHAGTAHLAFAVDDIHTEFARLLDAGVRFVSPPNEIEAGVNIGGWACYFLDPDEITLELVQAPNRLAVPSAVT